MSDMPAHRVHQRLAADFGLRPVRAGEGRQFALHDLASLAEGVLGECIHPGSLTVTREKELRRRLGASGREAEHDEGYSKQFWIMASGPAARPVGTVAVDRRCSGAVYQACLAEGLSGYRLETHWTWRKSVEYYLHRGLWVISWTHALGLARLSWLPRYEVRVEGGELLFCVAGSGEDMTVLLAAQPAGADDSGPWLRLRETARYTDMKANDPRAATVLYAQSTLALHLAARGWPLVREELAGKELTWSGGFGAPEGLAYMIGVFEKTPR